MIIIIVILILKWHIRYQRGSGFCSSFFSRKPNWKSSLFLKFPQISSIFFPLKFTTGSKAGFSISNWRNAGDRAARSGGSLALDLFPDWGQGLRVNCSPFGPMQLPATRISTPEYLQGSLPACWRLLGIAAVPQPGSLGLGQHCWNCWAGAEPGLLELTEPAAPGFYGQSIWRRKGSEHPRGCSTAQGHKHFWGRIRGNWADFPVLVARESVHTEQVWWDEAALLKYLILIAQGWFRRAERGRAGWEPLGLSWDIPTENPTKPALAESLPEVPPWKDKPMCRNPFCGRMFVYMCCLLLCIPFVILSKSHFCLSRDLFCFSLSRCEGRIN